MQKVLIEFITMPEGAFSGHDARQNHFRVIYRVEIDLAFFQQIAHVQSEYILMKPQRKHYNFMINSRVIPTWHEKYLNNRDFLYLIQMLEIVESITR